MKKMGRILPLFAVCLTLLCQANASTPLPANEGVLLSANGSIFIISGNGIDKVGQLPAPFHETDNESVRPEQIKFSGNDIIIATRARGLLVSHDKGATFKNIPVKGREMMYDAMYQRQISAVDHTGNFLAHKHDLLYLYNDTVLPVPSDLGRGVVITSVTTAKNTVLVGSSVSGLYSAKLPEGFGNSAKLPKLKFKKTTAGLPYLKHTDNHYIFEEIQSLFMAGNHDTLAATGIRSGLFIKKSGQARFSEVYAGLFKDTLSDLKSASLARDGALLWAATDTHFLTASLPENQNSISKIPWETIALSLGQTPLLLYLKDTPRGLHVTRNFYREKPNVQKQARLEKANGKKLFYVSAYSFKKRQKQVKALLERGVYNGLVIDLKDDSGYIRYDSKVPFIRAAGAVKPLVNLAELAEYTRKNNFYLVARIVVFKDGVLYRKPGYAILDRGSKKPWQGSSHERWVDAYNPDLARNYYAPLVQELTELGVDEIQLDYIRFPSDGPVGRCYYPHKKGDIYSSEALENFLYQVRQATPLPIGVDVYGYNGIYRAPGVIGQDIDVYGKQADVVSPMLYSSHFGDKYLTNRPRDERAFKLLHHSLSRATHIAAGKYVVRPWLQAFPMKNGIWGYGPKYFRDQISGSEKGGGNGFMFWGTFDHMQTVEKVIAGKKE